jgi:gliding motility-associated lipoprotein GldH
VTKNKVILILMLVGVTLISSCDTKRFYEDYIPVNGIGWHPDSVLSISPTEISDTISTYNILLMMRHTTEFKYKNMFFFVDIKMPSGKMLRDTAELVLQDNQGYWFGEGNGFIRSVEHTIHAHYKRNISFPESGQYDFLIQHGMRDSLLEDISDIGIRIERN